MGAVMRIKRPPCFPKFVAEGTREARKSQMFGFHVSLDVSGVSGGLTTDKTLPNCSCLSLRLPHHYRYLSVQLFNRARSH